MLKKVVLWIKGGTARCDRVNNRSTRRLTLLTHFGPGRALDGQIDGPWRLGLDPIGKPTERAVGGEPMLAVSVSKSTSRSDHCASAFIYRLYRDEGLTVRKRKARRKAVGTRATDYNTERPHSALDYQTPADYARTLTTAIARPAAQDDGSARRAIAQPAPIRVNTNRTQVAAG